MDAEAGDHEEDDDRRCAEDNSVPTALQKEPIAGAGGGVHGEPRLAVIGGD